MRRIDVGITKDNLFSDVDGYHPMHYYIQASKPISVRETTYLDRVGYFREDVVGIKIPIKTEYERLGVNCISDNSQN